MKVREVMTATPVCCAPDSTLREAARMMASYHCGEIPVVEGSRLVGVVTDRDITCRGIAAGWNPDETPVSSVMTTCPVTVSRDAEIDGAIRLMEERRVLRLPVVDASGALTGIISVSDIAQVGFRSRIGDLIREVSESYVHLPPGRHVA